MGGAKAARRSSAISAVPPVLQNPESGRLLGTPLVLSTTRALPLSSRGCDRYLSLPGAVSFDEHLRASVIANMSGIDVGDAASFAPMAAATPISATRVRRRPPQPAPIVVQEARSQSSPPRTKSSIVRPRITPKPMDASPLRMSSMAEATLSERCSEVLVNRTTRRWPTRWERATKC